MSSIVLPIIFSFVLVFLTLSSAFSQNNDSAMQKKDTVLSEQQIIENSELVAADKAIRLTIRNVDIGRFPEVNVIVEAYNSDGRPLDSLSPENLTMYENGKSKQILSIQKISVNERVPVDFVFVLDITGTMQSYIDAVKEYSRSFVASLMARGLDYRLGLVLFTDYIEKVYEPTQNVDEFLNWLKPIRAQGGMDEKENALEALAASTKLKYRPSANKVVVLITDAPYHQRSESGGGSTSYTTETICDTLMMSDIRVFSITNPLIKEYNTIAKKTRGSVYNIEESFAKLLDNFSTQLTNLYALKYISSEPALPDSVEIGIVDTRQSELVLVKKIIPIIEIGRKLIIENLLFELNSFALRDSVDELEIIAGFLNRKQNVRIQVEGHTDSKGSRALNQKLSERRAGAVKDYLIARGVQASRINVVGYGEDRPIATNETEFGRSLNRRTEIVIVDK